MSKQAHLDALADVVEAAMMLAVALSQVHSSENRFFDA